MNPMLNSYQQYKKHDVLMASPVELIVMLYNGAIKQLRLAQSALSEERMEEANTRLQKTQDIITELMMGLDLSYAIGQDLLKIYEFIHHQLLKINISKNEEGIAPIIEMLSDLRDAWAKVDKQTKGSFYAERGVE